MPKDGTKYRYLTVGLAWDSEVLQQLETDANKHQMGDQLAKMIALRITEYYELVKRGFVVPGITVLSKPQDPVTVGGTREITETRVRTSNASSPPSSEPIILPEAVSVGANANAALEAFLDEEDEE